MSHEALRFGLVTRVWCRKCREETLHKAFACGHCGTVLERLPGADRKRWNGNSARGYGR